MPDYPSRDPAAFRSERLRFIVWSERETPEGVTVRRGQWPQVRNAREGGADAGPTGKPWIHSNGWAIQLAQAQEPGKTVWLAHEPPESPRPGSFLLAAIEAEAYGGRWILPARVPAAENVIAALEFFEEHAAWRNWRTVAAVGVMSDFKGANLFLSTEVLNLASRRPLPYLVFDSARQQWPSLAGLRALAYLDSGSVPGDLRARLMTFAASGRLLIAPGGFITSVSGSSRLGYNIHATGKGEVAIPPRKWVDPFLVANDIHLLVGREADVLRLYNAGSMNCHYTQSPDGKRAVVHLLNYGLRAAAHAVTVALAQPYRSARLFTLDAPKGVAIDVAATRFGVEIGLPEFAVYAAIELES